MDGGSTAKLVNAYIEKEMSEFKKISEKELILGIAPAAKAAFYRKPYHCSSTVCFKNRPVLR